MATNPYVNKVIKVSFNLWDEIWEQCGIRSEDGQNFTQSGSISSTHYIAVTPNTTYYFYYSNTVANLNLYTFFYTSDGTYISGGAATKNATFTTGATTYLMRFTLNKSGWTGYSNYGQVCINVSGSKDGTYEPGSNIIMDISDTTAVANKVRTGYKFYDASGAPSQGSIDTYLGSTEDEPIPSDSIVFCAQQPFTLHVGNRTKNWNGTLQYSTDHSTWTTWDGTTTLSAVQSGYLYKLWLKGSSNTYLTGANSTYIHTMRNSSDRHFVITNTGTNIVKCKGDLSRLLNSSATSTSTNYSFAHLFYDNRYLDFDVTLPTLNGASGVFFGMFRGCSSLTKAPNLTFTAAVGNYACGDMFRDCISLKNLPTITVTTKTIGTYGFAYMFQNCISLTETIPLQEYTVGQYGCQYMYYNCTSLTTIDLSNITTSSTYALQYMCAGCANLTTITGLPSAALHSYALFHTFDGCYALTSIPSNITLTSQYTATYTFAYMFGYCQSLQTITNLTIQVESGSGTKGTYTCQAMFYYSGLTDASGIHFDTSIYSGYALQSAFSSCFYLITPPTLPSVTTDATLGTVPSNCCNAMFHSCSSLTTAVFPQNVKTLSGSSYYQMYYNCTSLVNIIGTLSTITTYNTSCFYRMFRGCTKLETLCALSGTTFSNTCCQEMYYGCTKILMSTTQTGNYQTDYRLPTTGTGTVDTNSFLNMFTSTSGTFKGTPTVNTTYYTSNTVV